MENNRSCWHNERGKDPGSTRGPCPGKGMRRHDSHHCAWCWPRPSSIPKPIPCLFGNAGGRKVYSCTTPSGCSARNVARADVSQFSAETVRTTGEGRNRLLGGKTQAVGTRSGSSPGHASPTSPPSRTHLQPLPSQASFHSARMSTEPRGLPCRPDQQWPNALRVAGGDPISTPLLHAASSRTRAAMRVMLGRVFLSVVDDRVLAKVSGPAPHSANCRGALPTSSHL